VLLSKPEVQVRVWYGTGYKPVPDPARRVKPNPAISANAGSGTGFFGTLLTAEGLFPFPSSLTD
jgi:hypothetical protein